MKHIKLFERYFDLNDPAAEQPTYQINYEFGKPKSITCLKCDMTSHNPNDIEHLYCGNCQEFHQPVEENEEITKGPDADKYANLPADMYNGNGPNWSEIEMLDDLKANFRSWQTDCNTLHDFNSLCALMTNRHPDVDQETIAQHCAEWIGFDQNKEE